MSDESRMPDRWDGPGLSGQPDLPDLPDEDAAERLLALFRYGAGAGAEPGASADAATGAASDTTTARNRMGVGTGTGVPAGVGRHAADDDARMSVEAMPDAPEALLGLLAAASAPARPHELQGYDAARAAFVAAAPRTRGRHSFSLPLARIAGVKVAALAGLLTVTGVAVAAEADFLPTPIQHVAHDVLGGVGVPDPDPETPAQPEASTEPASPSPSRAATGIAPGSRDSDGSVGVTGATGSTDESSANGGPGARSDGSTDGSTEAAGRSPVELCRAYVAAAARTGNDNGDGKGGGKGGGHLPPGQLRKLADLAGGEQNIPAYCDRVLGTTPAPPPMTTPQPTPTSATGTDPDPDPGKGHPSHPGSDPGTGTGSDPGTWSGHGHNPGPSGPAVSTGPKVRADQRR